RMRDGSVAAGGRGFRARGDISGRFSHERGRRVAEVRARSAGATASPGGETRMRREQLPPPHHSYAARASQKTSKKSGPQPTPMPQRAKGAAIAKPRIATTSQPKVPTKPSTMPHVDIVRPCGSRERARKPNTIARMPAIAQPVGMEAMPSTRLAMLNPLVADAGALDSVRGAAYEIG